VLGLIGENPVAFALRRLYCQLRAGGASERLIPMVLHFLIQGRVQGVGFRWYVQREAGQLDLRGWVRNTEEGEVEVVASGSPEELAKLRSSLRRGPRGARVDHLVEHYLDDSEAEELSSFRIDGAW
jgi:acylphosphatase